ncbi:hypothetical protein B0J14DRAFT_557566 [Halenospora varia]|nr:hypothetical protein B0J14DRAFT_557566 [Halenospora varia]
MGTNASTEGDTSQQGATPAMKIPERPKPRRPSQASTVPRSPSPERNHPRPNLPHTLSKSPPTSPLKDKISSRPLCCLSAIPLTVKHFLTIVPPTPTHNLLRQPVSLAPLLANLFAFAEASGTENTEEGKEDGILSPFEEFRAILQVTAVPETPTPSSLPVSTGSGLGISPAGYFSSGSPLGQSSLSPRSSQVSSLFAPNSPPQTSQTRRFWVLVQGSGGKWREISRHEAEDCIRPLGSGIMVGDGEDWKGLEGKEELWCPRHRTWWGVEGWVRES